MDDDILEQYRREAAAAMEVEAQRRIAESSDTELDERLRNTSLHEIDDLVPALLARLGQVRAALDGHGGGIAVTSSEQKEDGLYLVLDLTGACLSCGAARAELYRASRATWKMMMKLLRSVSVQACLTHSMTWVESLFWLTAKLISYRVI